MRGHIILFGVLYMWCSINLGSCGYLLAFGVVFICLLTLHLPEKRTSETTVVCIYTSVYFCGRSSAEIMGSNHTGGMDVCLL